MSDKPLFQNADEQEATYAPQQQASDDVADSGVAVAPATAGAFVAGDATPGPTSPAAAPAVGAAALAEESEENDDRGAP